MFKKIMRTGFLVVVVLAAYIGFGVQPVLADSNAAPRMASEAIKSACAENAYLFLIFYAERDALVTAMEETVNGFVKTTDQKVRVYEASAKDPKDIDVVYQYKIDRAPLPILLVVGPNGAVLGGFPKSVTADKLSKSLVPPLTMEVLKSLQQRKMAVVLLQNSNTKFNAESSKTANDLAFDKRLLGSAEVIKADPADPRNRGFLANARIAGVVDIATLVLIAPPGIVAGVFPGNVNKNSILSSLAAASSGSCAGGSCGPSGCK